MPRSSLGWKTQGGSLEEVFPIPSLEQSSRQAGVCVGGSIMVPAEGVTLNNLKRGQAVALGSTIINIADPRFLHYEGCKGRSKRRLPL